MKKGKFIVIDGIRGSGKSTIINYLKEKYKNKDIIFTREPGGSPYAEKIREVMLDEMGRQADGNTQFGLIWASRADHMKNTIIPALKEGKIVISDRFDVSTYGLQIYAQEAYHLKDLFFEIRKVVVGDHAPDIYICLDVDIEEGTKRYNKRVHGTVSHFHDREPEYYSRMRKGYLEFMTLFPSTIVDANKPLEDVLSQVDNALEKFIL